MSFIENLLHAKDYYKCYTHITSFHLQNKFGKQVLLSLSSYRSQIWSSEKSINLVQSHTWNKGQNWNLNWGQFYSKAIPLPIIQRVHCNRGYTLPFSLHKMTASPPPHPQLFQRKSSLVSKQKKKNQQLGNKLAPSIWINVETKNKYKIMNNMSGTWRNLKRS